MDSINARIKKIREVFCNDKNGDFASRMDKNANVVNNWVREGYSVGRGVIADILKKFPEIDELWLKDGKGQMLKIGSSMPYGNRIPFYDNVSSIGGYNDRVANMEGVSEPTEYIDTGDWFKNATAAIRHYGDSMVEYPPGCILALKEVVERQLVVWGKDYVIETNEYRITKRVQRGRSDNQIRAYSSNTETYPDGTLVHEPLDIAWDDIRRMFVVLGYVVKKNGGTIVFSNTKPK